MAVYRRGDRWYGFWKGPDGSMLRRSLGFTKRQAERKLAQIRTSIADGDWLDPIRRSGQTFSGFVEGPYHEFALTHFSPSSQRTELARMRALVRHFGAVPLSAITQAHIQQYKNSRLRAVKVATANRDLVRLKHILAMAVEWEHLKDNPARRVKPDREQNKRVRFLEPAEFERLLAHLPQDIRPLVTLAAYTGLRRSELFALTRYDVDLPRKRLRVVASKNGDARFVPLPAPAVELLGALPKRVHDPVVFRRADGGPIGSFRVVWAVALRKAGIENFRFHDLRHTYASWLVQAGVPAFNVAALLGHRDLRMVTRYAHLDERHLAEAVSVLDRRPASGLRVRSNA